MDNNWHIISEKKDISNDLSKALNVSNIIAHLLVARGITSYEQAKLFFRPELEKLHNPFLMKDMDSAVERIMSAIAKKEKILIYGDYDVDGTTAVSMMFLFLKRFNLNIEYYIPCRYDEGYGLSSQGISFALKHQFSLIISLDCGITAVEQVRFANQHNIDIIICDHHMPLEELPEAIAILNPKQKECNYPYKDLSGCGVGFKLIQAICIKKEIPFSKIACYLDLVAISIGADIVPMNGENRILAFYGLKKINTKPRESIKALMSLSTKELSNISISDLVFLVAPRINAAGRIKHAKKAVDILIEKDNSVTRKLAANIDEWNNKRKLLEKKVTEEALNGINKNSSSIVVFNSNWHKGVVGIVASRIVEAHYKPTIVLSEKDGLLTGSARSVRGFDLYHAISKCRYLCENFGGHKYAAGLSIKRENLERFIIEFEKQVKENITDSQKTPFINIDMEIKLEDINDKLIRILKQFAPFGPSNPEPVFVCRNIVDTGFASLVGQDKSHLRMNIKSRECEKSFKAIGFRLSRHFKMVKENQPFDICFSIEENLWNGVKNIQLRVLDCKKSVF